MTLAERIALTGRKYINSEYRPKDHLRLFLDSVADNSAVIEIGSGGRRLMPGILTLDVQDFGDVDILASAEDIPLADGCMDYVIIASVLEHVKHPDLAISEIYRILKPGGKCLCITPWVFPYHGHPDNYMHFSHTQLRRMFSRFSSVEVEMNIGPTCALTHLLSEYIACIFADKGMAYAAVKGIVLSLISWFKYLDRFWAGSPRGLIMASHLATIAVK